MDGRPVVSSRDPASRGLWWVNSDTFCVNESQPSKPEINGDLMSVQRENRIVKCFTPDSEAGDDGDVELQFVANSRDCGHPGEIETQ